MPAPYDDRYQLPSWPTTAFNIDLWNAVFGSIADRLTAREALEASFEALIAEGTQASLDYIQATIAPQIASLQDTITLAQDQIDQIVNDGIAPDSSKLGGQLPTYYATAAALTAGLGGKVSTSLTINGKPLTANVTLAKDDIGLGNVENKTETERVAAGPIADALNARIPVFLAGSALPNLDIGPIWHADYAAIMTWDGTGYASVDVGESRMFAFNAVPPGYLLEDGSAISRTVYSALFRKIGTTWGAGDGSTTFNLPDSRGEFIRGFDNGRGVDSGRSFAGWQDSDNKSHGHGMSGSGDHRHYGSAIDGSGINMNGANVGGGSGGIYGFAFGGANGFSTGDAGDHSHTIYNSGGSESRPRNYTRKFCIKF